MPKIHNKATYQRYYEEFWIYFIDSYCFARDKGESKDDAFITAKIQLQERVITDMAKNQNKIIMIVKAYVDIREEEKLYKAAMLNFENRNN